MATNEHDDWWEDLLAERRRQGDRDASDGVFNWPYQFGSEEDSEENAVYKEEFDQRRKELGEAFKWRV